jgi:hypothetical protein
MLYLIYTLGMVICVVFFFWFSFSEKKALSLKDVIFILTVSAGSWITLCGVLFLWIISKVENR